MGKLWDGSGIEIDPEFWALVLRVLKPGGYIVAFSSSRTYHRMACAIEDGGFITHPLIGWVYGQGFPKAHAADKAIDKLLGKAGEVTPQGDPVKRMIPGADQLDTGSWLKENGREYQPGQYVPATPEAAEWAGWAYGGQVRKPALEPIYVGQKPFSEKSGAANILKWGVGAVNIDGCRVAGESTLVTRPAGSFGRMNDDGWEPKPGTNGSQLGRHPANLITDGSPEVIDLFPNTKSGKPGVMRKGVNDGACYGAESRPPGTQMTGFGDEGSTARFFESYPFDGEPIFYQAKGGKEDRAGSRHPTVKPIALMQALVRHITPPGGTVLDPFAGSGTTGEAALREGFNCILMEAEPEYIDFLYNRFAGRMNAKLSVSNLNELLDTPSTDLRNILF
jgi:site-specific DNA-methyltransferase (adenine-specific)